jgi:hypothetical protein
MAFGNLTVVTTSTSTTPPASSSTLYASSAPATTSDASIVKILRVVFHQVPATPDNIEVLTKACVNSAINLGVTLDQIFSVDVDYSVEGAVVLKLSIVTYLESFLPLLAVHLNGAPITTLLSDGDLIKSYSVDICHVDGCDAIISSFKHSTPNPSLPCPEDPWEHFDRVAVGHDKQVTVSLPSSTALICAILCLDEPTCTAFQFRESRETCQLISDLLQTVKERLSASTNWGFYGRNLACDRKNSQSDDQDTAVQVNITGTSPPFVVLDLNEGEMYEKSDKKTDASSQTGVKLASGTVASIIVVIIVVITVLLGIWFYKRKKANTLPARSGSRRRRNAPTSYKSANQGKVENWNFIDTSAVRPVTPDDDGLTWDGEGLRLWGKDNQGNEVSAKQAPRPLSIKKADVRRAMSTRGGKAWTPHAPNLQDLAGREALYADTAGQNRLADEALYDLTTGGMEEGLYDLTGAGSTGDMVEYQDGHGIYDAAGHGPHQDSTIYERNLGAAASPLYDVSTNRNAPAIYDVSTNRHAPAIYDVSTKNPRKIQSSNSNQSLASEGYQEFDGTDAELEAMNRQMFPQTLIQDKYGSHRIGDPLPMPEYDETDIGYANFGQEQYLNEGSWDHKLHAPDDK